MPLRRDRGFIHSTGFIGTRAKELLPLLFLTALLTLSVAASAQIIPIPADVIPSSDCPPGFIDIPQDGCRFVRNSVPPPLGDTDLGDLNVPLPMGSLKLLTEPTARAIALGDIVVDNAAAEALGKAFFWDVQVGSDGRTACATCHHHAGVDSRMTNSVAPGNNGIFGGFFDGDRPRTEPGGTLSSESFPNTALENPIDRLNLSFSQGIVPYFSRVLRNVDDIVGSQGVERREYEGITSRSSLDASQALIDPIFRDGVGNTRQVTGRNTPTMINAAYNFRQFWDGRANSNFNGTDPFGPANAGAQVWVSSSTGVTRARLDLRNASLASQAVGPPNNHVEMAFGITHPDGSRGDARTFAELARKLLSLRPLLGQEVSRTDSVLGVMRHPSGRGLQRDYRDLIKQAFNSEYWDESATTTDGIPLIEANFSLFWGLAVQIYEASLISDDSPLDRFIREERSRGNMESVVPRFIENSLSSALSAEQKLGMRIFFNDALIDPTIGAGLCGACHVGSTFSIASHQGLRLAEVEASAVAGDPPLIFLEGPIEEMLMAKLGGQSEVMFVEKPDLLPLDALPMDCSIPSNNPDMLCAPGSTWPIAGGPMGKHFELRQNSTGKIIYKSFYPGIPRPCGQPLLLQFNPTLHAPPQQLLANGSLQRVVAQGAIIDIPDPESQQCTNMRFELAFFGLPHGTYSMLIDGIEQTRLDGSPLFTSMRESRYDLGFYNIGVRPSSEDAGVGGRHSPVLDTAGIGEPLSFARRLKEQFDVPELVGHQKLINTDPDGNIVEFVVAEDHVVDAGAFKVPSLRNVELTGPYFHNGGKSSLEQVVEFYNRGSDFQEINAYDLAPEIFRLNLKATERQALVAFLKALTDERVRREEAPFDHPSLPLPGGQDLIAVGRAGLPGECLPELQSFSEKLGGVAPNLTPASDCNGNGIADGCDIRNGASSDENMNGIPDECTQPTACNDGIDQDGDGLVDLADPSCNDEFGASEGEGWCDMDLNGQVDMRDISTLLVRVGTQASDASDQYDRDGDGIVTRIDALYCFVECKNRGCSTRPRRSRCGLLGIEALLALIPLARRRVRIRG